MNNFFVYALIDPRNDKPFYIGKGTIKLKDGTKYRRMREHFCKKEKDRNPLKQNVIKKINSLDLDVKSEILFDNLNEQDAFDKEKELISFYGRRNDGSGILTNLTDGGEGTSGRIYTEKEKEKCRIRMIKRIEENGVYIAPPEHYEKLRLITIERFKKFGNPMQGKKHTEETKKKLSEIRKEAGCNLPPDQRWRFGLPKEKNYFAKKTIFINPDGEEFEVIGEFRKFISDNGLSLYVFKKYLNKGVIPPPKTNSSKARIKSSGWQVKRT
jgi:hypothetical protein